MLRRLGRLVVATLAVAAASVVVSPTAQATTCRASSGVSVVVDFHQLGKGLSTVCISSGGGEKAADLFGEAGHALTYVNGEPFVCEVDGAPQTQCSRTPPANAYWSLWWSDGRSGSWTYASSGVESLHVPDGGYVALSWQAGSAEVPPGVPARAHGGATPTSHPTAHHTAQPTSGPSSQPEAPTSGPTAGTPTGVTTSPASMPTSTTSSPPPSTPAAGQGGHHHADPSQPARPHHQAATQAQADGRVAGVSSDGRGDQGSGSSGLPGWVAPVAVVVVFALAVTTVLRRKRSGGA